MSTVPYLDLATFKSLQAIKTSVDDDVLQLALEAAAEAINSECDRTFYTVNETAQDSERFYTPVRPLTLEIDDTIEVLELATDLTGRGSFDLIWQENRDFVLEPLNAQPKGRPFERVKVHPFSHYLLSRLPRSVRVTGVFGWPETPQAVVKANEILANRLRLRKATPYGVASFGTDVAMRLLRTDPDLQILLNDLTRDTVVYA